MRIVMMRLSQQKDLERDATGLGWWKKLGAILFWVECGKSNKNLVRFADNEEPSTSCKQELNNKILS